MVNRKPDWKLMLVALALLLIASYPVVDFISHIALFVIESDYCDFDDAYMFIRYADNLLAGHGVAWNPGEEPTYGATSLLYLFLVATARGFSMLPMGTLLSVVSSVVALAAVAVIVIAAARSLERPTVIGGLALATLINSILLFHPIYRYHAFSGMDTTLSILMNGLLLWGVMELLRTPARMLTFLVPLLAYGTFLTRPDNGLYALLFPSLAFVLLAPVDRRRIMLLRFWLVVGLLLVGDTLMKGWYFGSPLPLGHYAKKMGYYAGYVGYKAWNPINYLDVFLKLTGPFLLLLPLFAVRSRWRIIVVLLLPVILTFAYYFKVTQVMGHQARYYMPALPFIVVAGTRMLEGYQEGAKFPAFTVRLAIVLFGLSSYEAVRSSTNHWYSVNVLQAQQLGQRIRIPKELTATQLPTMGIGRARRQVAKIAADFPPGTVVAATEVGYLGALASHVKILDLAGLNDRTIATRGFQPDYLFDVQQVDLIWMPHTDYTSMTAKILTDPRFQNGYIFIPGAFSYGLAIRRNSPQLEQIRQALQTHWSQDYKIPLSELMTSQASQ